MGRAVAAPGGLKNHPAHLHNLSSDAVRGEV
jgi:hypothetical protein